MASCVNFDALGNLFQTGDPIASCSGFVLLDSTEFTDFPTLQSIFNMPLAADLSQLWMVGFSLPIIIYLTAWGFGVVINWFKPINELD